MHFGVLVFASSEASSAGHNPYTYIVTFQL